VSDVSLAFLFVLNFIASSLCSPPAIVARWLFRFINLILSRFPLRSVNSAVLVSLDFGDLHLRLGFAVLRPALPTAIFRPFSWNSLFIFILYRAIVGGEIATRDSSRDSRCRIGFGGSSGFVILHDSPQLLTSPRRTSEINCYVERKTLQNDEVLGSLRHVVRPSPACATSSLVFDVIFLDLGGLSTK